MKDLKQLTNEDAAKTLDTIVGNLQEMLSLAVEHADPDAFGDDGLSSEREVIRAMQMGAAALRQLEVHKGR